jgi:hypothetical protein
MIHIIHKTDKWTFCQKDVVIALLMCNYWYTTNSYVFEVPITEEKASLVFQCILDITKRNWMSLIQLGM